MVWRILQTEIIYFCACSFINNLYLFGGYASNGVTLRTCLKYDFQNGNWKKISDMNDSRELAACTVFEGKIVVSGGTNNNVGGLKSVEAYDHVENKWTNLPDMTEERWCHGSVSMGNKISN